MEINLTKETRLVHRKPQNITEIEKAEEGADKWENIPRPWTRRLGVVKMMMLPKATYGLRDVPAEIPRVFFT